MTYAVLDPATGRPCGEAPATSAAQLDAAVDAARAAWPAWAADEPARRAALAAAADRIDAAAGELAALITAEQGKPLASAGGEVRAAAYWLREYAGIPLAPASAALEDGRRVTVGHRPLGVVAAIVPWNFPLLLACWKLGPALLTGNTVVLKPSPDTPLATLRMGALLAGVLPPGVVAVVSGGDELGAALVAHPGVRKVSFTGSPAAGRAVARAAAPDMKRLTLELGGNDAAVVLDDADPAAIADAVFWSAFANAGQVCAAIKRLYVPRALAAPLTDALVALAERVTVGPGTEPGVELGPLTTRAQRDRVAGLVDAAVAAGARATAGGGVPDGPGWFFRPTILSDAPETAAVVAEEQFGPVLPVQVYDDVDEAVARANATPYGLCGSVWGEDADRALAVADRLECGAAYVNSHGDISPHLPFGGVKQSGVGVEHGRLGLEAYTDVRVMSVSAPRS